MNDILRFEDGYLPSKKERGRYSPVCVDLFRWTNIELTQSVSFTQEKIREIEYNVGGCVGLVCISYDIPCSAVCSLW